MIHGIEEPPVSNKWNYDDDKKVEIRKFQNLRNSDLIACHDFLVHQVIDQVEEDPERDSTRANYAEPSEKADIRDFQNFAFVENNQELNLTHTGEDGIPSTQVIQRCRSSLFDLESLGVIKK